jgi:hypothetical protein
VLGRPPLQLMENAEQPRYYSNTFLQIGLLSATKSFPQMMVVPLKSGGLPLD